MNTLTRVLFVLTLLSGIAACAPMHTVKPLPDFVESALEPGDRITVTTYDGETHEFVVKELRGDLLVGENVQFALKDLASIKKHAWSRPDSPCGGEKALGCSLPLLVSLVSDTHSHYRSKFYDACAQHDYCYRHGFASYGLDRNTCDREFLLDMKNLCPAPAAGKLGKTLEIFDDSVDSRRTCLSVAEDYYEAVHQYGEDKFLTANSTYCEYNGPASSPISAATTTPTSVESR